MEKVKADLWETYRGFARPKAKTILSASDLGLLEQYGAAVVECSWKRVDEVPLGRIGGKFERLRTC